MEICFEEGIGCDEDYECVCVCEQPEPSTEPSLQPSMRVCGPILLIEDQDGFGGAQSVLVNEGFDVTVLNYEYANNYANLLNTTFLNGFNFIVYGERGDGYGVELPMTVAASLESYLQEGGNLLVTGYDTLGDPNDATLASLVRAINPDDQVSYNPTWETANLDNFILNGPYGDFRNITFNATSYDDDVLIPDTSVGTLTLAITPGESARIIFNDLPGTAGTVGYWNGGFYLNQDTSNDDDPSNAQPDFSDGGIPQKIFLNWADGACLRTPQ